MPRLHKYRAFIDGKMVYFHPLTLTGDHQHIAGSGTDDYWIDDYFDEEPADLMQ
jgi:hypothetical protein